MTTQQLTDLVTRITESYKTRFALPATVLAEADVQAIIAQYLVDHPEVVMTDAEVETLIYDNLSPADDFTQAQVNSLMSIVPILAVTVASPQKIVETTPVGTVVATAAATYGVSPYLYSIAGTKFSIDPATGEIKVNANLVQDSDASYTLAITVLDDTDEEATTNLVVNIAVAMAPAAVTIDEHTAVDTVIHTMYTRKGVQPYTYSISGTEFDIDVNTGEVTVVQDLEYDNGASYSPTVTVTDATGDTDTETLTVNIAEIPEVIDSNTTYASLTAQAASHNLIEADFSNTTDYGVFCTNNTCGGGNWCSHTIVIPIPAGATTLNTVLSATYIGGIAHIQIAGVESGYIYISTTDIEDDPHGHSYQVDGVTILDNETTIIDHDARAIPLQAGDTQIEIGFAALDGASMSAKGFNAVYFTGGN